MISGATCTPRLNASKAEFAKIKLIDENINYTHRIILRDIIVQQFGKEYPLNSLFTLDKAPHTNSLTLNAICIQRLNSFCLHGGPKKREIFSGIHHVLLHSLDTST